MKIKILGCSGGIGGGLRTTSILVDDDMLIDTGSGIGDMDLPSLKALRHVLLTHSHLDHSGGLPLLVDTAFEALLDSPLQVHGRRETLEAIRKHIFNWVLWPDFSVLPEAGKPVMRYVEREPGSVFEIDDRRIHMIDVNHTVPAVAYVLEAPGGVFAFSGDTKHNDTLWPVLNALPRLDVLVIETAFGNRNEELAELAGHYSPRTLAADLERLEHDPQIWLTHLKPGEEDRIFAEAKEAVQGREVHRLDGGEEFTF